MIPGIAKVIVINKADFSLILLGRSKRTVRDIAHGTGVLRASQDEHFLTGVLERGEQAEFTQ